MSESTKHIYLLCAQVNSASYPQRDGKRVVAYGLWGESLVWLIGAVGSASCKPRVQLFADVVNGWSHSALRYHELVPISCHLRDCKVLLFTYSCKKRYNKYRDLYLLPFISYCSSQLHWNI